MGAAMTENSASGALLRMVAASQSHNQQRAASS
jgi:hypothetical protein